MARPYSKRALAELIFSGHDTASSATIFARKITFIQHEQSTPEYQRILARLIRERRPGVDTARVTQIAEDVVDEIARPAEVNFIRFVQAQQNVEQTELFRYNIGNPPGTDFVAEWFASQSDFVADVQLPESERPVDISFNPETPVQAEGDHLGEITFTPVREGLTLGKVYVQ